MKKFIILLAVTIASVIAQPVYANDAPGGSAPASSAGPTQLAAARGSDIGTWILISLLVLGAIGIIAYTLKRKLLKQDKQREERSANNARELARISSTLLAALIALLTFLLVIGVQNSIKGFTTELYTAIILLGIGLILYALCNVAREAAARGGTGAVKILSVTRGLQQLLFVGSIVAVVWFVVSYAQLVLKPPTPQPQPESSQSQQPSTSSQPATEPQQQPAGP